MRLKGRSVQATCCSGTFPRGSESEIPHYFFFFLRPLTIKDTLLSPSLAGSCSSSQYWLAGSSVLSTQQACLHNIPGLRGVLAALFTEDMEAARVTQLVKGRLRFPPFRQ